MNRLGKTAGAATTYVVLAGLQRGVSLLILPFVTHAMSPVEYGAASMLTAAALLLTTLIAAPLIPLIVRAAARGHEDGPALLRAAGTYCYFIVPAFTALAAAVVALFIPDLLGVSGRIWGIELLAVGFQPATSTYALWVAQGREDIRRFVWISSTSIVANAASKILFVVTLQMGVLGWVISDLVAALSSAIFAFILVRLPSVQVTRDHIRHAVRFTLPLIPHLASLWILASLSRPAMAAVSTLEQVGLLAFGLTLAQFAGLVLTEANRAALVRYSRETLPAPTDETRATVRAQIIAALIIPAIVGCGVASIGPWIFAAAYWPSFALTGVLLVGQAAYGLYLIPMNYLTQTAGLTRYTALASGAGAVVILVGVLAFGRSYGAIGVGFTTAAAFLTMAVVAFMLTKTHRLIINWLVWITDLPAILLATAALGLSIAALASTARSSQSLAAVGVSLTLGLGSVAVAWRSQTKRDPKRQHE